MRISRSNVDIMFAHATAHTPEEACGLLSGDGDMVNTVYCLENARHSAYEYELSGDGYRLLIELEEAGQLMAAFHSHPMSEAYPSPADRRQAFWPIRYVIVSLQGNAPEARVFRIVRRDLGRDSASSAELGTVYEETLEIV